ncbi:MAG: pyrroline-5-carboxylate reductase [Actinomycetota bacterium]|nr:pyrroline-5-carboxylate reductase [Actinomycetota bacterium]
MVVSFIGAGRMCEALLKGIIESNTLQAEDIHIFDIKEERLKELHEAYGARPIRSAKEAARVVDIVILAVKPQDAKGVLSEVSHELTADKVLLSIVAGLKTTTIKSLLTDGSKVVRVMPNNPALLGAGISAITFDKEMAREAKETIERILLGVGEIVTVGEELQDLITALSGSGPAYFYLFAKHLIETGVDLGIDLAMAKKLILQTMLGSAKMAKETNMSLEELIKMVASPSGTTEAALKSFEANGFKGMVDSAVKAAFERAKELGQTEV